MRNLFIGMLLSVVLVTFAQSYNGDKVAFTNFLVRMYENAPFEGVRVVNDYEQTWLVSVVALDKSKYQTEAVLNRVASVKAMVQASRFFTGSTITSDLIIHTTNKKDGKSDTEIIENIRENTVGYVKALEQITNFVRPDGLIVFLFVTPVDV